MALTRRVQVFISEEASEKFDLLLAAHKLGPTALMEALILRANPLDDLSKPKLDTKLDSQPAIKPVAGTFTVTQEGNVSEPIPYNTPLNEVDAIIKKPLGRDKVVSIPKPGKK